jgi:hypothetical protein
MNQEEAIKRVQAIITVWEMSLAKLPPEVREAQTSLVVMRQPDIEALRVLLKQPRHDLSSPE